MKTPLCVALISAQLIACAFADEVTLQTLPPGAVLDPRRPVETRQTLEAAVASNQIDLIHLAIHNEIDYNFCMAHIESLAKGKQAQLHIQLLHDDTFLPPVETSTFGNAAGQNFHRYFLTKRAGSLLNVPPASIDLLTREQKNALAERLQAVK